VPAGILNVTAGTEVSVSDGWMVFAAPACKTSAGEVWANEMTGESNNANNR
jgi:hypothetical protein